MDKVVRRETLIIQVIMGQILDLRFMKSQILINRAYVELLH